MNRLKFKFWIQKYKKFLFGIVILVLVGIILLLISKASINENIADSTVIGVAGTLLGAVIGGFLSLMGSLWINSKQQRATQNIKKKNVIYSPLYDELVDIQNRILVLNPYPNYVVFEKGDQIITSHPQFLAWGHIKADTRYLEVPDILVKQMEQLESAIRKYLDIRNQGSEAIQKILNEVLLENELEACNIINIGDTISSDILNGIKADIYHKAMEIGNRNQLDDDMKTRINAQVYEKCNNNEVVLEIRRRYDAWIKAQREAIEMLSILIKQVLLEYEG